MISGDEFYGDDVTSGPDPDYYGMPSQAVGPDPLSEAEIAAHDDTLLEAARDVTLMTGGIYPDSPEVITLRRFVEAATLDRAGRSDAGLREAAQALVDALPYEPGSMLGGKIALVRAALALPDRKALEGSPLAPSKVRMFGLDIHQIEHVIAVHHMHEPNCAALAPATGSPRPEGLDVERLAQAVQDVDFASDLPASGQRTVSHHVRRKAVQYARQYAATPEAPHKHDWVDARNTVVASGEVCLVCGAVRATPEAPHGD